MYVYEIGTVDNFIGMTRLKDYIDLCNRHREDRFMYMQTKDLKSFLLKAFIEIKETKSHWGGDIRGDEIYIGAIPHGHSNGLEDPSKFIVFKQDDGGSTFIVSEILIHRFDSVADYIPVTKTITKIDLLKWFDESFDLVESLFNENPQPVITKDKYDEFEQIG